MLGDFNGNGVLDIIGRRAITNSEGRAGDIRVWFTEVVSGVHTIIDEKHVGQIGLEWKIQVADMDGDDRADIFGYNANNDLWVWYNVGGRSLNSGKNYGNLGTGWQQIQLAYLDDVGPPDIIGGTGGVSVHGWYTNGVGITSHSDISPRTPIPGIPLAGSLRTVLV